MYNDYTVSGMRHLVRLENKPLKRVTGLRLVRSYRPLVVTHQVADTVYQRADACRRRLFCFSCN